MNASPSSQNSERDVETTKHVRTFLQNLTQREAAIAVDFLHIMYRRNSSHWLDNLKLQYGGIDPILAVNQKIQIFCRDRGFAYDAVRTMIFEVYDTFLQTAREDFLRFADSLDDKEKHFLRSLLSSASFHAIKNLHSPDFALVEAALNTKVISFLRLHKIRYSDFRQIALAQLIND
jgi:hypothetical protein